MVICKKKKKKKKKNGDLQSVLCDGDWVLSLIKYDGKC